MIKAMMRCIAFCFNSIFCDKIGSKDDSVKEINVGEVIDLKKDLKEEKYSIRKATTKDYTKILALNKASVEVLSPMDKQRLIKLAEACELLWVAQVSGEVVAFLLAFTEKADYDSVNYQWFDQAFERFLYIDRVVVDKEHRGRGIGGLFYKTLRTYAKTIATPRITAEIDIEPPNPASLLFHQNIGFKEVGRQSINGGKKVVSLQTWSFEA